MQSEARSVLLLILFLFSSVLGWADSDEIQVPTVVIDNQSSARSPVDPLSVFKIERVDNKKFSEAKRQSLADLVADQVGVDNQVYCANCGAKRLSINGLKGEHTSILVDGLPLHSAVSSFYGVDAVPINGLSEVQVMRGAGASLTNPEAIGGTLNLVTADPLSENRNYRTSVGVDDRVTGKSQNHSVTYNWTGSSKRWGIVTGGQYARNETWDLDNNLVSESPQRENYSVMAKSRVLLGKKNDLSFRVGHSALEILGGYWDPIRPTEVRSLAAPDTAFVDGSVEKRFIGNPAQITDWVDIDRREAALTGTHYLNDNTTLDWKVGFARQSQDAIYQHGFDYSNIDNILVGDASLKWAMGSQHLFTLGTFIKDQRLRSLSQILFEQFPEGDARDIPKDNFDNTSYALYGQYSFLAGEALEIDLAVRADQVDINWLELANQVQETVVAPRLQILHNFNDHLSERFSYGLGYRAPLTFFESQHGNFEGGYQVDITELEKAHSLVYSLSWNTPDYYVTGGIHYTHLKNMAFGFEVFNRPILYRNSEEDFDIWVVDLLTGFKPNSWWLLEASFEAFEYQDGYKIKLPTAAIERRVQLRSTIERQSWQQSIAVNIVGERDLSKYGSYAEHYVDRNQASEPTLDPNLELKNQTSPTYLTVDMDFTYEFDPRLRLTFGINNLFNYTQAGVGDTPAAWHWHFNHAHYDGLHTWGPNIGRQWMLTLSGNI